MIHSSPNITRNGCTEPNKAGPPTRKDVPFVTCQHHLPSKKSYGDNFHALLIQTITITTSSDSKAPSTLQIALYKPLVVDLKYSVPPLWIIHPLIWTVGNPRVRRSRSMGRSILDCLPRPLRRTPRSIFRRSIPSESAVRVLS